MRLLNPPTFVALSYWNNKTGNPQGQFLEVDLKAGHAIEGWMEELTLTIAFIQLNERTADQLIYSFSSFLQFQVDQSTDRAVFIVCSNRAAKSTPLRYFYAKNI